MPCLRKSDRGHLTKAGGLAYAALYKFVNTCITIIEVIHPKGWRFRLWGFLHVEIQQFCWLYERTGACILPKCGPVRL